MAEIGNEFEQVNTDAVVDDIQIQGLSLEDNDSALDYHNVSCRESDDVSTSPTTLNEPLICQPCEDYGSVLPAEGYCVTCGEHLCTACIKHHTLPRPMRGHVLQGKLEMPRKRSTTNVAFRPRHMCPIHDGEVIASFCSSHNMLCCKNCVALAHELCADVNSIEAKSEYIEDFGEFKTFLKTFNDLLVGYEQTRLVALQNIKEIDWYYDQAMLAFKQTIDNKRKKDLDKITKAADICEKVITQLGDTIDDIEQSRERNNTTVLFIRMLALKSHTVLIGENLRKINQDTSFERYIFQPMCTDLCFGQTLSVSTYTYMLVNDDAECHQLLLCPDHTLVTVSPTKMSCINTLIKMNVGINILKSPCLAQYVGNELIVMQMALPSTSLGNSRWTENTDAILSDVFEDSGECEKVTHELPVMTATTNFGRLLGTTGTTSSEGGLSGTTSTTPTGGGLFGATSSTPIGGGLFGATITTPSGGGLFGATSTTPSGGVLFGATSTTPSGGGLFGAPSTTPSGGILFRATSTPPSGGGLFGAPSTTPSGGVLFGATSTTPSGGSLFGATSTTPSGGVLFGATSTTPSVGGLFGATSTTPSVGGLFGAPSTTASGGGLFGAPSTTPSGGGLFGAPRTTPSGGGLFGAPSTTPSGGGLFGTPSNTPSGGGLFGAPNTTSSGGVLFGATSTTPSGGGIFGAQSTTPSAGGLFGAPSTTPSGGILFRATSTTPSGGGLFGARSTTPSGGVLFGATSTTPSGGGLFGARSTTPSGGVLFGATSTTPSGGGIFGATSTTPSGSFLFGATSTTPSVGGLFGATSTTPSGEVLFGATSTTPSGGLFGATSTTPSKGFVIGSPSAIQNDKTNSSKMTTKAVRKISPAQAKRGTFPVQPITALKMRYVTVQKRYTALIDHGTNLIAVCKNPPEIDELDTLGQKKRNITSNLDALTFNGMQFIKHPACAVYDVNDDIVYVTDSEMDSVFMVTKDGECRCLVRSERLASPAGIILCRDGTLMVCCTKDKRVVKVTKDGRIYSFIGPLKFEPLALAYDEAKGLLYIGGKCKEIYVYNA